MKRARRVALALAALWALAALGNWIAGEVSLESRRASLEGSLSSALGREVRLGGELHLDLFPRPALEASEVVVANEPGAPAPYLLRIQRLRLVVALWPLLRKRLELVQLEVDGADLRLDGGDRQRVDVLPQLAGLTGKSADRAHPLALRIEQISLANVQVSWRESASGRYTTLDLDGLEFVAPADDAPVEWRARGSLRGGSFQLEGRGGTLAALLHPSGPWPVSLEGQVGQASVRISGQIERPTRLQGLDLDVQLEISDVGSLLTAEPAQPGLGAARLRGHLADPGGEPGLDHLVVESDPDAELRLRITGSVRRLSDPSGIDLDGQIDADRLRFLELALERPLPEGRLHVKFRLSDLDGTIGVEGEAHAQSRDGSLRADISGGMDDIRAVDALDARVSIAAPSLQVLEQVASFEPELPALGPVAASARVRARAGAVGFEGLELDVGRRDDVWLSLHGSVADLRALQGVALDASAGAHSLAALGKLLRPARSLPDVGPLDLHAALSDARGPLGVERFELTGGTPATLTLSLSGSVADVREIDGLAAQGSVRARDAALLGSLLGIELPPVAPVSFDGRVAGSDERLESDGSTTLGQTRIQGRWLAQRVGKNGRPRIDAELHSPDLRLEDLGLGHGGWGKPPGGDPSGPDWRSGEALPFEELRRLDAHLELRADRVTAGDSVDVRNAHASMDLEDGDLRVRDVGLEYQGGSITGELDVDARTPDVGVALRTDARSLDLTRLGVALGRPRDTGSGQLDLAVDVASSGASPDALRRGLGGRVAFAARDWSAATPLSRRFVLGLSRSLLPSLRHVPDRLGCFQGALQLTEGVAAVETLVLASQPATVVGAGSIDLAREKWHLELVPEVHDPGLLEVASAVRVTGPLDSPQFSAVPLDLVAGTLRSLVRGALLPARTLKDGARRVLRPLGRLASGSDSEDSAAASATACNLPGASPR